MDAEHFKRSFHLDTAGRTPIYVQLANYLRFQIKSGVLKPEERMLPEEELCQLLSISRTTVRQAINLLVEQGLLQRYRGKGTFVSKQRFNRNMTHLYNFSHDMAAIGVKPSSKVLKVEVTEAWDEGVRDQLELTGESARVFHLYRVRCADGEPMIDENTYIPYFLCEGIEKLNFEEYSLYEALTTRYGLALAQAEETLEAVIIPSREQKIFGCPSNTAGFQIHRIARLDSSCPYEYTTSITRADICFYQFKLSNAPSSRQNSNVVVRGNGK